MKVQDETLLQLGRNIRKRRQALHMTQARTAAKMGCSQSTISDIEHGKRDLTAETLIGLCSVLTCSAKDLLADI